MRFITFYTTYNDKSVVKFDWNDEFEFNFVTKYDYMTNEKHNVNHWFDVYVKIFAWKTDSLWNQVKIKSIFRSHIYFIKHSDEQRLNEKSSFQNLKTNQREKIAQTVWKHVTIHWFIKHHWNQRFRAVAEKMIAMSDEKNDAVKINTQSIQFLLKRWMQRSD